MDCLCCSSLDPDPSPWSIVHHYSGGHRRRGEKAWGRTVVENLIQSVRKIPPDIEAGWNAFLKKIPPQYHPILRERMDEYRNTIIKKILSKTRIKTVITELQDFYACSELEVDYD